MRISDWSSDVCSSDLARIEAAREAGTLDQGLETVRVDHFTVTADELLRTDPVTGAETRLVSLEVTRHLRPLRLQRLVRMREIGSSHAIPMRNERSGKVALSVPEIGRASCRESVCQ